MSGNRHGQSRTLFRIGSGAQFIQQHQRLRGRRARDEINISDVRRESRKILLNGLVVANIGEHGVEHRKLSPISRHRKSRLRHQRQQADGLECDGLAAGIRSRDDELPSFAFQFHTDRDDGNSFRPKIALQQRMSRVVQQQPGLRTSRVGTGAFARPAWAKPGSAVTSLRIVSTQLNRHAVIVLGEMRLGKLQLQFTERIHRSQNFLGLRSDALRHLQQDAVNFRQFLF